MKNVNLSTFESVNYTTIKEKDILETVMSSVFSKLFFYDSIN
jgi:hypothetical protein